MTSNLLLIAVKKAFGYLVLNVNYRDRDDGSTVHYLQWTQEIVHASREPNEKSGYNLALLPYGPHNCVDEGCPD